MSYGELSLKRIYNCFRIILFIFFVASLLYSSLLGALPTVFWISGICSGFLFGILVFKDNKAVGITAVSLSAFLVFYTALAFLNYNVVTAIKHGDIKYVKSQISNSNVNMSLKNGETPLTQVCKINAEGMLDQTQSQILSMIDYLISIGADVNQKNNSGEYPLLIASERALPLVVEELIKGGANPNIKDENGNTPIYTSICLPAKLHIKDNVIQTVEILIKYNADISVENKSLIDIAQEYYQEALDADQKDIAAYYKSILEVLKEA